MPISTNGATGKLAVHNGKKVVAMFHGGKKFFTYKDKIVHTYTGLVQSLSESDHRYNGYYVIENGNSFKAYQYAKNSVWNKPWTERVKKTHYVTKYKYETYTEEEAHAVSGFISFADFDKWTMVMKDGAGDTYTDYWYGKPSVSQIGAMYRFATKHERAIQFGQLIAENGTSFYLTVDGREIRYPNVVGINLYGSWSTGDYGGVSFHVEEEEKTRRVPYQVLEEYYENVEHPGYYTYTYGDPDCSISQSLPSGYKFSTVELSREDGSDTRTISFNSTTLTHDANSERARSYLSARQGSRVKITVTMVPR